MMMPLIFIPPMTVAVVLGVAALFCLALLNGRGRRKPAFDPADYRAKALLSPGR